jgi:phytanoyl-CoA hydroxylase
MPILSKEQKLQFEADGFLIYGPILTLEELQILQERIDSLASGEGARRDEVVIRLEEEAARGGLQNVAQRDKVWQVMNATQVDEAFWRHACNPRIVQIVSELLQTEDILLFGDQTLMKPAYHGSPVSWHQDSAYWTSISPPALISCWTALDPATEENGCVRMVAGSHKMGVLPHRRDASGFLHVEGVDTSDAVPVILPAGGCSFHHSCTVHGSGPNRTPHRRRGLVTSYMRADSEWVGDLATKPHFRAVKPQ